MSTENKKPSRYVKVGSDMAWPAANGEVLELARKVLTPDLLTEADKYVLSSIVRAYVQMVSDPIKKRNMVCRELRRQRLEP